MDEECVGCGGGYVGYGVRGKGGMVKSEQDHR